MDLMVAVALFLVAIYLGDSVCEGNQTMFREIICFALVCWVCLILFFAILGACEVLAF